MPDASFPTRRGHARQLIATVLAAAAFLAASGLIAGLLALGGVIPAHVVRTSHASVGASLSVEALLIFTYGFTAIAVALALVLAFRRSGRS